MEKSENGKWDFAVREERAGWKRLADREAGLKVKELLGGSTSSSEKASEVGASDRQSSFSELGLGELEEEREPGPVSGRVNPIFNIRTVIADRTSMIPRPTKTWPHSQPLPPASP